MYWIEVAIKGDIIRWDWS